MLGPLFAPFRFYELANKSTVISPSPAGKRATNLRFAGGLFFCAVLLDVLVELVGEG